MSKYIIAIDEKDKEGLDSLCRKKGSLYIVWENKIKTIPYTSFESLDKLNDEETRYLGAKVHFRDDTFGVILDIDDGYFCILNENSVVDYYDINDFEIIGYVKEYDNLIKQLCKI